MWAIQQEKINKQYNEKERVNYFISKNYKDKFKQVCQKHGLIMSVVVENAIKRFVDSDVKPLVLDGQLVAGEKNYKEKG